LSSGARRAILDYAWPGNVRELKSAVERSILISDTDEIEADDLMLFDRVQISPWVERVALARTGDGAAPRMQPDRPAISKGADGSVDRATGIVLGTGEEEILSLDDLKRQAVERAYKLCEGNVDRAAVELGIGRATMYRLLKKYELMQ
ncbi:MAG: helix-turn-helix domain-containing protein, partial [Rhodothermales bacterium]|nr:helix-turn-helix domain-containing protein [Rhodothermales bacterium]